MRDFTELERKLRWDCLHNALLLNRADRAAYKLPRTEIDRRANYYKSCYYDIRKHPIN